MPKNQFENKDCTDNKWQKGVNTMPDDSYTITRETDRITVKLHEYFGAVECFTFHPDQLILCAAVGHEPYLIPAGKASNAELLSHVLKRGFVA